MNAEGPTIRLLLVDDHPAVRVGLRARLEQYCHIAVVGEASNGKAALALVKQTCPHIVLLDLSMPGGNGELLIKDLSRMEGGPLTLVYSGHSESERMHIAQKAGARGYVCKDKDADEVVRVIERVLRGEHCFPEGTLDDALELTPREMQVAILIAKGLTSKEIGELLEIGIKTVNTYRGNIHEKLRIKGPAEITREVKIRGLDEVDWTSLVSPRSQAGPSRTVPSPNDAPVARPKHLQ